MPDAEPASILDASALISFLHDEPGSDVVVDAITATAAMSVVNWAEPGSTDLRGRCARLDSPGRSPAGFRPLQGLHPAGALRATA